MRDLGHQPEAGRSRRKDSEVSLAFAFAYALFTPDERPREENRRP
jgi:hypothetical protein